MPTLGLEPLCPGAVVRIEGVARPLALGVLADIGMLGPRECRVGRDEYTPGRGVAEGSSAIDFFRAVGMGVEGTALAVMEASESGGDGGVTSGRSASDLLCGGVEAVVGDESAVATVEVSDTGDRGRSASLAKRLEVLR